MAHEEILRDLQECKNSEEFVAYHKWGSEPGSFLVGAVRELSATQSVFQNVDTAGRFEPDLQTVPLRLIHSLHRGSAYLRGLRVLNEIGPSAPVEPKIARSRMEIRTLLETAASEGAIVHLWTAAHESADYAIQSVGEETIVAQNIVDGGAPDGRWTIRLNRIVQVRLGRSEIDSLRIHRFGLENGLD